MDRQYIGPGSLSRPHRGRRLPSKGQSPSRVHHPGSVWSRLQLQVVFFSLRIVPMWPEMSGHTSTNCSLGQRPLFGRRRDAQGQPNGQKLVPFSSPGYLRHAGPGLFGVRPAGRRASGPPIPAHPNESRPSYVQMHYICLLFPLTFTFSFINLISSQTKC